MIDRRVSPRYAKVLFNLDCAKGCLEKRLEEFDSIIKVLKDHPQLVKFLKARQINLSDKKKVLQNSFKEKIDSIFMNFLFYLIEKGRLFNLIDIANEYRVMANEHLRIWEADIVTAVPLDSESEAKLKKKLEEHFDKKINLYKKIDPNIIGGAILITANEMLDWSVAGRLRKLKENLIAS